MPRVRRDKAHASQSFTMSSIKARTACRASSASLVRSVLSPSVDSQLTQLPGLLLAEYIHIRSTDAYAASEEESQYGSASGLPRGEARERAEMTK